MRTYVDESQRWRNGTRAIAVVVAILSLAVLMLFQAPGPANAAGKDSGALQPRAAYGCTVTMDNPHYSDGANGVIVKARVTCSTDQTVTFTGHIGAGPLIGPHAPTWSAPETRTVKANKVETFYVPRSTNGTLFSLPCSTTSYYSGYGKITVNGQTDEAYANRSTTSCG